jgi:hypothetical protein
MGYRQIPEVTRGAQRIFYTVTLLRLTESPGFAPRISCKMELLAHSLTMQPW